MHEFLNALPPDRREAISAVRFLVNRKLPPGYRETIGQGTIVWCVPLEACPDTYNGQPLTYAALANQKNYMALYLMTIYGDPKTEAAFRAGFAKAGKRLDMGKACVRFRKLEDLHLPAVGHAVAACSMDEFIRRARAVRETRHARPEKKAPKPASRPRGAKRR